MKLQDISPWGGLKQSGLRGLFAEDCPCCNKRVLILQFALVEVVAGHLKSSLVTHCWAQES